MVGAVVPFTDLGLVLREPGLAGGLGLSPLVLWLVDKLDRATPTVDLSVDETVAGIVSTLIVAFFVWVTNEDQVRKPKEPHQEPQPEEIHNG